MSKLSEHLNEIRGLERFDTKKETLSDIASIGKDLISLSRKGSKMDGSKTLSRMRDLYDELYLSIQDLEDYLGGI
jgi:hypothetical protein